MSGVRYIGVGTQLMKLLKSKQFKKNGYFTDAV